MKYGYLERERRFLVKRLPPSIDLEKDFRRIRDRYFPNTRLRLREITDPTGQVIEPTAGLIFRSIATPQPTRFVLQVGLVSYKGLGI